MGKVIRINKGKKVQALAVPDLTTDFMAAQDVRETSKQAYRKGLEKFLSWLAAEGISQPDRESILRFKSYLMDSGLETNTVNCYLVAVKRFFAYLEGKKKYPNVAKDIKGVRRPRGHLRDSFTPSQVRALLSQIDTSTVQGKRDYAIINLMARTGLRTMEVVRADVGDIRQNGGETLLNVQGKGRDSKDSFVILTEKSLFPILHYLGVRGKADHEDPLFVSLSDRNKYQRLTTRTLRMIVKENLRNINIDNPKLSAHSFRHFFAIQSLRAGAQLLQVKEAMRHASIETTQKYLHVVDRIQNGAERFVDF
jgi:integrase/recombinase XerD